MPIEKDPVIFTTLAYAVLNSIARGETNESYRFKFRRNSISNFSNFQRKTDFNVKSPIISISKNTVIKNGNCILLVRNNLLKR